MGKILVIAEKPSVGRDIAKAIGANDNHGGYMEGEKYIVSWAVGHLIGLKYPQEHDPMFKKWDLATLPLHFDISDSLKVLDASKDQFKVVKEQIAREDVDLIINAGDAGREGYLIQEWIYRMAGNKKPVRVLWASSLTAVEIKSKFADITKLKFSTEPEYKRLLAEAEARAEDDWLTGMNYSRALTLLKGGYGTVLSYGSCQAPLLHLLTKREDEIEAFKPSDYWQIKMQYDGFFGVLCNNKKKTVDFKDKKEATEIQTLLTGKSPATVKEYKISKKSKKAPLLFNLAELQKTMGSKYKYKPEETLEIAQALYEKHKVLSYPRTESRCISTEIYGEIQQHIDKCKFGAFKEFAEKAVVPATPQKPYVDDAKITDHYALIPTLADIGSIYPNLSERERNVLDAVISSFLAIFLPDYRYSSTEVIVEKEGYDFFSKGITVLDLGYKAVFRLESEKEKEEEEDLQKIPVLKIGQDMEYEKIELLTKTTKAPARYTVSSIISLMEKHGIGTAATRAEIIKKLERVNFISLEKSKYTATELGRKYILLLPASLKDVDKRKHFEEALADIGAGKITKDDFLTASLKEITKNIEDFKKDPGASVQKDEGGAVKCPFCKASMHKFDWGWGCPNYKTGCKGSLSGTHFGHELTEQEAVKLLAGKAVGPFTDLKKKDGDTFTASLRYDTESGRVVPKFTRKKKEDGSEAEESEVFSIPKGTVCPACGSPMVSASFGWKCSKYKESCTFALGTSICGYTLTKEDVVNICNKKETEVHSMTSSKTGKVFQARLFFSENEKKLQFKFA